MQKPPPTCQRQGLCCCSPEALRAAFLLPSPGATGRCPQRPSLFPWGRSTLSSYFTARGVPPFFWPSWLEKGSSVISTPDVNGLADQAFHCVEFDSKGRTMTLGQRKGFEKKGSGCELLNNGRSSSVFFFFFWLSRFYSQSK